MGVIWTEPEQDNDIAYAQVVTLAQAIRDQELCECGCPHVIHTHVDSVDDGFSVTGIIELCEHAADCGCTGFWN